MYISNLDITSYSIYNQAQEKWPSIDLGQLAILACSKNTFFLDMNSSGGLNLTSKISMQKSTYPYRPNSFPLCPRSHRVWIKPCRLSSPLEALMIWWRGDIVVGPSLLILLDLCVEKRPPKGRYLRLPILCVSLLCRM